MTETAERKAAIEEELAELEAELRWHSTCAGDCRAHARKYDDKEKQHYAQIEHIHRQIEKLQGGLVQIAIDQTAIATDTTVMEIVDGDIHFVERTLTSNTMSPLKST